MSLSAMPPSVDNQTSRARTHNDNRKIICAVSFRKCGGLRVISKEEEFSMKSLPQLRHFSLADEKLPVVICNSCCLAVKAHAHNPLKPQRKLQSPNYEYLTPPSQYSTRSISDLRCQCTVCCNGRETLTPGSRPGSRLPVN